MGKYFVPFEAGTPASHVREAIDRAENTVVGLRGTGVKALELLHLLDQADQGLRELQDLGADVRAEKARFETVSRQLRGRKKNFVAEVGAETLREERARTETDEARWWWFLDEAIAEERRRRVRRTLIRVGAAAVILLVAWLVYDNFLAPPPNVREALRLGSDGQALAERGEIEAALAAFEAATELDPTDAEYWVWKGVMHAQLSEEDEAQAAFDTARDLYGPGISFLLGRGMAYLRIGDVEAAYADSEQAAVEYPEEGWAYSLRASVFLAQGDYAAALDDLERAADLAAESGNVQLEAYARTQRAMVIQLQVSQPMDPSAGDPQGQLE